MGLSSKTTKTNTDPWKPAQPYILQNLKNQQHVYDSQQPQLEGYAKNQRDTYGRLAPGAEAGIVGAQGVVNHELDGSNLNGNPYIDGIWNRVSQDTTNNVNSQFEGAGRYGSGDHAQILARELASAHNNLLYQNYNNERTNQVNAVGQASGLMSGAQGLLNNAAELPWTGVNASTGNVRQASNGYGTTTTKEGMNYGQMMMQAAAAAAQAAAAGSDRRMKKDIIKRGTRSDGLNRYEWTYRNDPDGARYRGFMADEVETLYPEAFITNFNGTGFAGVNYAAIPVEAA